MNNYTLWAQIGKMRDGTFVVKVTAIPLGSKVLPDPGDLASETAPTFVTATSLRDELVKRITRNVEGRGGRVLSIDSTLAGSESLSRS